MADLDKVETEKKLSTVTVVCPHCKLSTTFEADTNADIWIFRVAGSTDCEQCGERYTLEGNFDYSKCVFV